MSNLESNGAASPSIVIKQDNTFEKAPCGVCKVVYRPDPGPWLYLEGTYTAVCDQCARNYAAYLLAAAHTLRQAEWRAERERRAHKQSLLTKYAEKPATVFVQFDGWWKGGSISDADEPTVDAGMTCELMRGSDVRVLIPPRTTKE